MRSRPARAASAIALAALACGAFAVLASAGPISATFEDITATFNARVSPKTLPPKRRVPVSAELTARFASTRGAHVTPISRATIDIDRDVAIDPRGVPVGAIVGGGTVAVEVEAPGGSPARAEGSMTAYNGGVAGGVTSIEVRAAIGAPVNQDLTVPISIAKLPRGTFGLRAKLAVPQIAAGAGSITAFDLHLKGRVGRAGGRPRPYLSAKCPDGNLLVEPTVEFVDGTGGRTLATIGCKTKG